MNNDIKHRRDFLAHLSEVISSEEENGMWLQIRHEIVTVPELVQKV